MPRVLNLVAGCVNEEEWITVLGVTEERLGWWTDPHLPPCVAYVTSSPNLVENRLKEVQEMQWNCDKGLGYIACEAPLVGPMAELWKLRNFETLQSEWAVQATPTSIYS
ncbi:hypothetical protein GUJ93_ZPchr0007g3805 [Zizania palustris]|uniref:Uncharacterized protein n=1 Tax=Zizania palustris TaxID=103762 RepID=A0A8J5W6J4_ZIZPA|nr:hypothetical protein GUJ93_ZPchr0007g3805 [Zizania palustris]